MTYHVNRDVTFRPFPKGILFCILSCILAFFLISLTSSCEKKIFKSGYKIARDPRWYPLDVRGKEKNLVAFSDDLLVQIGLEEGIIFTYQSITSDKIESALFEGEVDGILSPLSMTGFRKDHFIFSDPYFLVGPVLIILKDSDIQSLSDLKEKDLGVLSGGELALNNQIGKDVIVHTYPRALLALDALIKGELDGMLVPAFQAFNLVQGDNSGIIKVLGPPLTQEGIRLIARKEEGEELIEQFNDGLKPLRKKGEYKKLIKKWGLYNSYFD